MVETTLSRRLYPTARILSAGFILTFLIVFIASLLNYHEFAILHPDSFSAWNWTVQDMDLVLNKAGLSFNWWVQWNFLSSIIFAGLIAGIGIFLFIRKRNDWFILYLAISFTLFGTMSGYSPGIISSLYPDLGSLLIILGVIPWVSIFLIFYLFPNGKFVPRWSIWAAVLLLIEFAIDIVVFDGGTPPPYLMLPMMLSLLLAPISQIYRYYRISNSIERQQTKWVMLAMLVVMLILLTGLIPLVFPGIVNSSSPAAVLLIALTGLYSIIIGLIPFSIAFAVLRYRLYDIDVIIRKTLLYTLLTGLLSLVYFGGVALLQMLLDVVGGRPSPVIIVLTTLMIAALFNPLRHRLQALIDRRFYRQKYDAEKALAEFTAEARSETDLEQLSNHLVSTIQETLHPQLVSLWMKPVHNRSNPGK